MTLSQQDLEWASSLRSPYTQSHTWRTEPEIDIERQAYLTRQLALRPDPQRGVYPFKDVALSRADIEWLLATHQQQGPVDWSDQQRTRLDSVERFLPQVRTLHARARERVRRPTRRTPSDPRVQ